MQRRNLTARAARWSATHRKIAIFGWLGAVVVAVLLSGSVGLNTLTSDEQGNGESGRADRIQSDAGLFDRATEQVLIQSRQGESVSSPAVKAAIADTATTLRRFQDVRDVKSPLVPGNEGQLSSDGKSALVVFDLLGDEDEAQDRVDAVLDAVAGVQQRHPTTRVEEFGDASADKALSKAFEDDFRKAESLSLPITLLILVLAFGSLVAAGLPILLGLSAVAITLGLLAPISQIAPVDEAISSVILLIGLAVGVDYSLFYIRRERDERAAGHDPEDSLDIAAATSGRAVLISGCTVVIAMSGMYITGNSTFTSFATGTIIVVLAAMVGSLTVLPALLSKLGDRVMKGRLPLLDRLHRRKDAEAGAWSWIVDRVLRRPVISATLAGGLLVVLAIPAFSLHTVTSGANGLPRDLDVVKTYDRIQAAFPGGPLPALVVVKADEATGRGVAQAMRDLRDQGLESGQVREPVTVTYSRDGHVAVLSMPIVGDGTDTTSERALATLRDRLIPRTLGQIPGVEVNVTGITAGSKDFNDLLKERAPFVFLFVLGLAFLLLLVTFRSIVIPVKAILLNLLSVGAAYGVLVWIFQYGHLEDLLGFKSIDGVTAWLPLFLFVILFGLSMDYHVFILTRVREAFDAGQPTSEAVRHGIKSTASVVTSAAIVMVGVFGIFATLSAIDFKMMGIGLATAVLIDATIVRAVLLPASMKLLGDWNWYLPRWLEWLPQVAPEEPATQPAASGQRELLELSTTRSDGTVTVVVDGELSLATARSFAEWIRTEEAAAPERLVIDLRAVRYLDSAGLQELVAANTRARRAHRRLVLLKSHGPIERVLAISGVDQAVETVDRIGGA